MPRNVTKDKNRFICLECKKEYEKKTFHPFCSNRCKTIDLGNWLGEKYQIPANKTEQD